MEATRLALIGVPSSAGGRRTGQDAGPGALRAAELSRRLRSSGLDVRDMGDLPPARFRPDLEHPKQQNLPMVVNVAGGLDVESVFQVLKILIRSPKCLAVVITEFNAELDTDGAQAERLVNGLVRAFSE